MTEADVGKRVAVQGYSCEGVLRFFGKHAENGLLRCGVELDRPEGKNNGVVRGHTYFKCKSNHGVLCPPAKVSLVPETAAKNSKQKQKTVDIAESDIGKRVTVFGYESQGTLRFLGMHQEKGILRAGVELDEPIGKNNGTVGGHSYFSCQDKHGVLCHPGKVTLLD